jgi:hypothetical protein
MENIADKGLKVGRTGGSRSHFGKDDGFLVAKWRGSWIDGRSVAHNPNLGLLKFSVKVVRHKKWVFFCGRVWKRFGRLPAAWRRQNAAHGASRGTAPILSRGVGNGRRCQRGLSTRISSRVDRRASLWSLFPPRVLNFDATQCCSVVKYVLASSITTFPERPFEHLRWGNVRIAFARREEIALSRSSSALDEPDFKLYFERGRSSLGG